MKKGAKRQIVVCPSCHKPIVSLGEVFFRCCGENFKIKEHLLTTEQLHPIKKEERLEAIA